MTKAMNRIKITALTAAMLVMLTMTAGCGKKKTERINNSEVESKSSSTASEVSGEEKPDEIDVGGEEEKGIAVDFDPNKTPTAASSKAGTKTEGKKSESSSGTAVSSGEGGKKEETPSGGKDSSDTGSSEAESGKQEGMDGYTPWK